MLLGEWHLGEDLTVDIHPHHSCTGPIKVSKLYLVCFGGKQARDGLLTCVRLVLRDLFAEGDGHLLRLAGASAQAVQNGT